jgi:transcriptional regulator with XRE-family HTH domain
MNAQLLIALKIRRLRVAKGMLQDDLALIAGVERSCADHLERGGKNPTVRTLEKLRLRWDAIFQSYSSLCRRASLRSTRSKVAANRPEFNDSEN